MMNTLYLMSQHFGKVTARVLLQGRVNTVELVIELPEKRSIQYRFVKARLDRQLRPGQQVHELAIRLAVTQTRRLGVDSGSTGIGEPFDLDCTLPPWMGDLSAVPYGGATAGIEARVEVVRVQRATARQERRFDDNTCRTVERAVNVQKKNGIDAAVIFLTQHGVPEHIVLRVVSCAAFRRK